MKTGNLGALLVGIFVLALAAPGSRAADEYPNKSIQLICPYGAGGLTDLVARMVADKMGKMLNTSIQVINKPGGGTSIGESFVAASKPDGYTLLINMTGGHIVTPMIIPNLPYKMTDLKPIGKMVTADYMVLVGREVPVNTLSDLVAYAKTSGKFAFASPGVGTVNHLALEELNVRNGAGMQHIPYNSELQVINALLGNHVQAGAVTVPFSLKYVRSNQVKAVAVLASQRDPLLPDVATSAEQGFPELIASIYNMLFVPAKTPPAVLKQLEDALQKTLQDRETIDGLKKLELRVDHLRSADTEAFIEREVKKWAAVVTKANIKK